MDIAFEPKSQIIPMRVKGKERFGTLSIENNEPHNIKYKVRTTLPNDVVINPQTAVIKAKDTVTIQLKCLNPDPSLETKMKFIVMLLSLKDLKDSDNMFTENESNTEKHQFKVAFELQIEDNFDMFKSPKNPARGEDSTYTAQVKKNIAWLKK